MAESAVGTRLPASQGDPERDDRGSPKPSTPSSLQEERISRRKEQRERKNRYIAKKLEEQKRLQESSGGGGAEAEARPEAGGAEEESGSEASEVGKDVAKSAELDEDDLWQAEASLKDTKIAIIGNVDSGKSTLVGVLTKGGLDDGRGKARAKVFNFSHEAANGRTSSIAQEIMGFREGGEQVVMDRGGAVTAASRNAAWTYIVGQAHKIVTFIDLCGHEKYLKTTIFGLVGLCPDHAMIIVNANAGFQRMSREHLGIALALSIPITIVVTKIDIAPQNVFEENMAMLCKLLKSNAVKRPPLVVKSEQDLQMAVEKHTTEKVCPIFCVSNVTGEGLDLLRSFIQQMRSRLQESGLFLPPTAPTEFHIDGTFNVLGVGAVVAGIMRAGRVRVNQQLMLGPDNSGQFKPVLVRSIHYKRVLADQVESGQACSFSLRSLVKKDTLKKASFRKGMVLVDASLNPVSTWVFKAEVIILHHATTIRKGYQALIHCGIIRQAAQVRHMSCELLRTGDKAIVTFKFMYHAEYLKPGCTLLFREGRTKGLGTVVECLDESALDETDQPPLKPFLKTAKEKETPAVPS